MCMIIENSKREKWKSKNFFYMNSRLKDGLASEIHNLIRRTDAKGSNDVLPYLMHVTILSVKRLNDTLILQKNLILLSFGRF